MQTRQAGPKLFRPDNIDNFPGSTLSNAKGIEDSQCAWILSYCIVSPFLRVCILCGAFQRLSANDGHPRKN